MFQQVICLKKAASRQQHLMFPASAARNIPSVSSNLCLLAFFFSLQLFFFPFLLSPWWFTKHDIITQHLSEGSVTCFSLQIKLYFDLQDIPSKVLCRGVESWTVTAVYFCHIHHQDDNHRKKKTKHRRPRLPFRRGFGCNWIWEWLKAGKPCFLFLTWLAIVRGSSILDRHFLK